MLTSEMKNWADRAVSNVLTGIDVTKIRLQRDRIILEDLPENEASQIGAIWLPDGDGKEKAGGVGKNGLYRLGRVVAVGPGEHLHEKGMDAYGDVRLAAKKSRCECCGGSGEQDRTDWTGANHEEPCSECDGTGKIPVTVPCSCKPGDVVVYDRRREAEFIIDGKLYCMVYEEQSVVMVLDGYDSDRNAVSS